MIVPFQSASLVASLLSARVVRRLGTRVLLVGGALGIAVVGTLLFGQVEDIAPGVLPHAELFSQARATALGFNLGAFALALSLFALLPGRRAGPASGGNS